LAPVYKIAETKNQEEVGTPRFERGSQADFRERFFSLRLSSTFHYWRPIFCQDLPNY